MRRTRMAMLYVKGLLQRNAKLLGMNPGYYLGAVALLAGFAASMWAVAQNSSAIRGTALAAGLIGAVAVVGQAAKDTLKLAAERDQLHVQGKEWGPEAKTVLPTAYVDSGYQLAISCGQTVAASPKIDERLLNTQLPLEVNRRRFVLVAEARRIGPMVLSSSFKTGRVLYNNSKVRLETDLFSDTECVSVGRTDYYSGLCTNEVTGSVIRSRRQIPPVYDGWAMVREDGVLFPLAVSPCSNHIGISTVAITRDLRVILTVQPKRAAQNADLLVPSGSGSADFTDARGDGGFQEFLARAMERELWDECGLAGIDRCVASTHITGFARLIRRGGKPEFFGVTLLDLDSEAVERETHETGLVSAHIVVPLHANDYREADYDQILASLKDKHAWSVQLELALGCIQRLKHLLPPPRESGAAHTGD